MTALSKAARAFALASLTAAASYVASSGESKAEPPGSNPVLKRAKDDRWLVYGDLCRQAARLKESELEDFAVASAA